ncbi:MAG: DNA polymerase III subunit gamma/tau [Anaerolineae bacterium]|nr:DNA polymerase III subunit gamma/tau [Anaerolineae bacterium]
MSQALYRKWRPQTFDEVVGQQHIVRTLRNALQTEHIHHAYLLAGPRGTGKTTTARLIAKAVNCLRPVEERPCNQCDICVAIADGRLMDLVEIDAASNTGVDNIREILEKVGFRPTQARYKVYVVDEVHMLSTAAFNALLKTLEEPPEHVIFILATTEVHKIPATVLSRCQRFEFRRIPLDNLVAHLQQIAGAEGIEAEPEALDLIARAATGCMRDAISLFDQMAAGGQVTAEYVRLMLGAERREVVQALVSAWLDHDLNTGLRVINRAIDGGADPRQLARQISDFLRGLLLMRLGTGESWSDPTAEERPRFQEMAREAQPQHLVEAVRVFSQVASESRTGWQPQLPLELAFVEVSLKSEAPQIAVVPTPPVAVESVPHPATEPHATVTRPAAAPRATAPRRMRSLQPGVSDSELEASPTHTTQTPHVSPSPTGISPALVSRFMEQWRDVVRQVQPVNLGALLRDANPLGADTDGMLVLGFQHTFHREKVNEEDNRRKVEDSLSHIGGQQVRVRCVLAKDWTPPQSPAATKPGPAQRTTASHTSPPPPEPPSDPVEVQLEELAQRAEDELGAVRMS